jgi:hypothetical protein
MTLIYRHTHAQYGIYTISTHHYIFVLKADQHAYVCMYIYINL